MSAKILAAMQKMDASLSLIADNLVAGQYETEADLQRALNSANTAVKNATRASAALAAPAKKGRAGIKAMATTAFDEVMTATQQCQIKASLLTSAIQAELDEMEENQVTDEIQALDFDEPDEVDTNLDRPVEVTDNGHGDVIEQEEIVPTDNTATEAEVAAPVQAEPVAEAEVAAPAQAESHEDEEIPELELEDEAGETDLLDLGDQGEEDSFFEEEEEGQEAEAQVATASSARQALRASASSAASSQKPANLESCWNFTTGS